MHRKSLFVMTLFVAVVLAASGCGMLGAEPTAGYSWQETHARVTPEGDLEWSPRPFVFEAGDSVRYIDFERGDDEAAGTSPGAAWKHHPWDPEASGNAATCEGVQTYVFRRGVVYRGNLVADESGEAGNPIRLTSDPSWGSGEACIHGTVRITGGWEKLDAESAPACMPDPQNVWFRRTDASFAPTAMWEVHDGAITRIQLAREPDWEVSNPDDVKSEWYEWEDVTKEAIGPDGEKEAKAWGIDTEHLTATAPDAYDGATVWTEYAGVMGTPYANAVEAYDPQRHAIRFAGPWGDASSRAPIVHCRYYLDNHLRFLDQPGEYYYTTVQDGSVGVLYVRLPADRDPNQSLIEAASKLTLLDIRNQSHIHVTGLTFRFQNVAHWYDRWWTIAEEDPACVKALGTCSDIRVANCRFEHTVRPIYAQAGADDAFMDDIVFTDNEVVHSDYGPIHISRGGGELHRVKVLRNRLYHVGFRPMRAHHGHAVQINFAALPEIAGNILDRCWGAGLFIFGGKGSGNRGERPLSRVLMHHNKVTDPLLNTNDWGGVESWQGGPTYVYNNISGNPGGYWHWSHVMRGETAEERGHGTARFGFAYYLDGAFKQYVFNNIAWGKSNDLTSPLCNCSALQEVLGFLNAAFNNTFYKFGAGGRRHGPQAGRNCYLGNVWMAVSDMYFRHADIRRPQDANIDAAGRYATDTLAYAGNVFHGSPRYFGSFDLTAVHETLEQFRASLTEREPLASSVGRNVEQSPVRDADGHDFRPTADSPVIDGGVKFFVPWGLYGVVGEWHFYRYPSDPSRILGEHWYMTPAHAGRGMYRFLPRHDLKAHGVSADSFIQGELEDWTEGALVLNGVDQYCVLPNEQLKRDIVWGRGDENVYPGGERRTPDMDSNNFLIEAVVKTVRGRRGGAIVSKAEEEGYTLDVDAWGRARMGLQVDGSVVCWRSSSVRVNDGNWHHVVAEVDRSARRGINVYVDGELANGTWAGQMPAEGVPLSNTGDFYVGRSALGNYFAGALDFLRVSRGTLADARTTIGELYEWQFNGPFLRDFFGNDPVGRRDAGAIECVD